MKFIDRSKEIQRLDALIKNQEGGLAVLWGRRRIGKTRLLLEWSGKNVGLYTVADQSASTIQRVYFAGSLSKIFKGIGDVIYPDWKSLLNRVVSVAEQRKWHGPLIFDEFPHLVVSDHSLPSVFQNWIDHEAKNASLTVVISGSSQRMMQGLVLDSTASLYGRASQIIKLNPLFPVYMYDGFKFESPRQIIESYAIWGGIPRYWELACEYKGDLDTAVDSCVLDTLGPLHDEPDILLKEETSSVVSLRPLLDIIGSGVHRISEIAARLGQPATSLARPLSHLMDLGFVKREISFGESEKSTKRSVYKISDPFFRFWFKVVAPHRSLLAEAPSSTRLALFKKFKQSLFSEMWEELCRKCVPYLQAEDTPVSRSGPWGPARRYWRGNNPEWDIVAESLDGKRLLLGEVKWYSGQTTAAHVTRHYQDLIRKGIPAIKNKDTYGIVYALFIPETPLIKDQMQNFHIIDAQTVVSCLK